MLAVALAQRLQRLVRVAGAQVHSLRLVVEDAAIGGEVAQAHDGAQRLVRQGPVVGVAHGQLRVVDLDGVGADQHGVGERAEPVGVAPGCGAGDPAAGAVGGSTAAVEGGGELPGDEGAAGLDREGPDPVEGVGVVGEQPVDDLDAGLAQGLRAACRDGVGVTLGVHHPSYAGGDQRLRAGAGAAGVVAGLEGDHGGRASSALPGHREGVDLGVRRAGAPVEPLGHGAAVVVEQDAADAGVGAGGHARGGRDLEGAPHGGLLGGGPRGAALVAHRSSSVRSRTLGDGGRSRPSRDGARVTCRCVRFSSGL